MHANQWGLLSVCRISHHDRNGFLRFVFDAVSDHFEFAVLRRQFCICDLRNKFLADPTMRNQVFDRDDLQVLFVGDFEQLVASGSTSLVVQDFAKHAGWLQPRHASKIDGCFSVTRTTKDATFFCHQQVHVAGPLEVVRFARWISNGFDAQCPLFSRDPGSRRHMIQRSQERRLIIGVVVLNQWRELQSPCCFREDRHAEITTSAHHQINCLWRRQFRGADVVSFVFTMLVVENDDDFASSDRFDSFGNGGEIERHVCLQK